MAQFALSLQCHPEETSESLERWYVGHACELGAKKISVSELRAAATRHAPALANASYQFWNGWLDSLFVQQNGTPQPEPARLNEL